MKKTTAPFLNRVIFALMLVLLAVIMVTFVGVTQASAAYEAWVARYDGPANSLDSASAIAVDASGNVYVTGTSVNLDDFNDYCTIKYDTDGNQLWVARYDANGGGSAIAVDSSGNVYVTGSSGGIDTQTDYATIKYDTNGNQLWVARYDGPAINLSFDMAEAIAVDSSGNVYVTGFSKGGSGRYWENDYATIKYDTDGNQLWVRRYDGPPGEWDEAHAIAVDGSGNVYVTGFSDGVVSGFYYDYATIKYDTDGNQLWVARYDGPPNSWNRAWAIAVDALENVYVTGLSHDDSTADDYATIKYDTNGNQLWVKRYSGPLNNYSYDEAEAIAVDGSGNVYVTGTSNGVDDSGDYCTIKYDTDGNQLWVRRYEGPANYEYVVEAIAVDESGNVYITGYGGEILTHLDYTTIKYDTDGNQIWVARYDAGGGPGWGDVARAIALDGSGNTYVTGESVGSGTDSDYATIKYGSTITLAIDIKPGSDPNSINCNNEKGVITVAILTTDDFDATTVDHTSVAFVEASETHVNKKSGELRRHEEDVDGDGDTDLVFHFRLGETELTCDSIEGTLTGETFDGQAIEGSDAIRMVGGEGA
jgi:hypothetical protein